MNNVKIRVFILALLVSVSPLSAGWFSNLTMSAKVGLSAIWNRKGDLLQNGIMSYLGSCLASHPVILASSCTTVAALCAFKGYKSLQKRKNLQECAKKASAATVFAPEAQKRGETGLSSKDKRGANTVYKLRGRRYQRSRP